MRARMGICLAQQPVNLRPIVLKNKPAEMLIASPKGEVPVLVINHNNIIDESLDIMIWALKNNDPNNLLYTHQPDTFQSMISIINKHDDQFTKLLSQYKVSKRYHKLSEQNDRERCEKYVYWLEQQLTQHNFIMGKHPSIVDYAVLPFIRQFAKVDRKWYRQSPYPNLRNWLNHHLQSNVFSKAMVKHPLWLDTLKDISFP